MVKLSFRRDIQASKTSKIPDPPPPRNPEIPTQKPKVTFSEKNFEFEFPPSTETEPETLTRSRSVDSEQLSDDQSFTKQFQDFLASKESEETVEPKSRHRTNLKRPSSAKSLENINPNSKNTHQVAQSSKTKDFVPFQSVPASKPAAESQTRTASTRIREPVRPVLTTFGKSRIGAVPAQAKLPEKPQVDRGVSTESVKRSSKPATGDTLQTTLNDTFDVVSGDDADGDDGRSGNVGDDDVVSNIRSAIKNVDARDLEQIRRFLSSDKPQERRFVDPDNESELNHPNFVSKLTR